MSGTVGCRDAHTACVVTYTHTHSMPAAEFWNLRVPECTFMWEIARLQFFLVKPPDAHLQDPVKKERLDTPASAPQGIKRAVVLGGGPTPPPSPLI